MDNYYGYNYYNSSGGDIVDTLMAPVGPLPLVAWIGIGVGALVLIIIIAVVVSKNKKKKARAGSEADDLPPARSSSEPTSRPASQPTTRPPVTSSPPPKPVVSKPPPFDPRTLGLKAFGTKYSSRLTDSCAGHSGIPCHDKVPFKKQGCMAKSQISGTVPLNYGYASRVNDSCTGVGSNYCHDKGVGTSGKVGYVWSKNKYPGKMLQLYRGYASRVNDSCTGVQGTPCHGATMSPQAAWIFKPEYC